MECYCDPFEAIRDKWKNTPALQAVIPVVDPLPDGSRDPADRMFCIDTRPIKPQFDYGVIKSLGGGRRKKTSSNVAFDDVYTIDFYVENKSKLLGLKVEACKCFEGAQSFGLTDSEGQLIATVECLYVSNLGGINRSSILTPEDKRFNSRIQISGWLVK